MTRIAILIAALAWAGNAHAAGTFDRLQLRLDAQASVAAANVSQSNLDGLDNFVLAIDTGLFGTAVLPLDGGGEVGGRVAFDLDYATNFDSFLNDAGRSDVLDEAWVYWEDAFGRLQFGLGDGVGRIMGLGAPTAGRSIRLDNPEIFLLGYPCRLFCSSDPQAPGSLFSPNGMQLRSDVHGSDDYIKLMYFTPVFHGLRFAVSFAPDGTRDPGQLFGGDERNEQGNIWDFAVRYAASLGPVDLGFSASYVTGENVNRDWFRYGDLEDWGGAARIGWREWSLGAAFRRTNVAGGGPVVHGAGISNVIDGHYTDTVSAGLTWESGPWLAGVNWILAREEVLFDSDQDGEGVQIAAGYTFGPNVRLTGGWQHFEFDGPNGTCVTDTGGPSCDTLDGDVLFLETSLTY